MAIIKQWSGDGVTTGQPLTTATVGPEDEIDRVAGSLLTVEAGDLRGPAIRYPGGTTTAQNTQYIEWWTSAAPLAALGLRFYLKFDSILSSARALVRGLNGTSVQWQIMIANGAVRIVSGDGSIVYNSYPSAITAGQWYRFETTLDGDFQALTVFQGDSESALIAGSGMHETPLLPTTFTTVGTPTTWMPGWYMDDLALGDTAEWLGPAVLPPAQSWYIWDGASEIPITLEGEWDGSTIQPASFDTVA